MKLQVPVRLRSRQALPYATSNFLSSLVTGALRAVLCTENRIRCVGQYRDAGDPSPRQRDDKVEGRGTPWREWIWMNRVESAGPMPVAAALIEIFKI